MKKALLALLCLLPLLCAARADAAYKIGVDIENQIVTVYRADDDGEDGIVRQMICSTGRSNSTPRGTFKLFTRKGVDREEWYYIAKFRCFVQYPTRIYNDILFHSLPYSAKDLATLDQTALAQLGDAASHGCIRLYSEDANCGKLRRRHRVPHLRGRRARRRAAPTAAGKHLHHRRPMEELSRISGLGRGRRKPRVRSGGHSRASDASQGLRLL